MKTIYNKFEIGIGVLGLISAPVLLATTPIQYSMSVADVFKWLGVVLLGQGLIRDLVIIKFYRKELAEKKEEKKGLWLCLESTLGLLLICNYLLLLLIQAKTSLNLSTGIWVLVFSIWWLFGYFIREFVLELKRDPNHLNLVVGL